MESERQGQHPPGRHDPFDEAIRLEVRRDRLLIAAVIVAFALGGVCGWLARQAF
jgi:hypothetical protein